MIKRLNKIYHEFPSKFWVVVLVAFIDRIGGTLLFPFFSLYITQKFHIGMTQAGIILGVLSAFGLVGSMVGGALTDKFGRRRLILFGLVFSAMSTLSLGLANTLAALYPLIVVIGLLSNIAGPAHDAMIADILPEKQRAEGFGILRVAGNLAWIIGPTIGGVVAARSFFMLFVIDFVLSCIVAVLFYKLIPETKPVEPAEKGHESVWQTVAGYRHVLRDFAFMAFLAASILMLAVYQQMYNTLPVYLRDTHGFSPSAYGFFLTTSAITVVLFQFWVTRQIKTSPALPDDGAGDGLLCDRLQYDRVHLGLCSVSFGQLRDHNRRNDHDADQPGISGQLCPGGNARPLHGGLWTILGHPRDDRPRRGWIHPG